MIKLLDCTLRDGGYVNDWNFGEKTIKNILIKLIASHIDIVECGFLSEKKIVNSERSIYSKPEDVPDIGNNNKTEVAAMINYGEYDIEHLPNCASSLIKIIRVAFHKVDYISAVNYSNMIAQKGYKVFLQPMNALDYSEEEYKDLIFRTNDSLVKAFYIVDTFGNMRKADLGRLYDLCEKYLRAEMILGFHSHNNMQLSFSNAQELIAKCGNRDIIIDSSVFGMGRGAGNLCTELMIQYLNENWGGEYNLLPILECIDDYINPIYIQHAWGYSVPYYLAAINSCHPNYANYLIGKQTLCVKDINIIIKMIPSDLKVKYDEQIIKKLYLEYLARNIDDSKAIKELEELCKGKTVLLLAPGKTLVTCEERIIKYIAKEKPIVFGINHIPTDNYGYDRVFISNLKRFNNLEEALLKGNNKIVCTSNISNTSNLCVLNYADYLNENDDIFDNSGTIIINILRKIEVKKFALAGYDGFKYEGEKNYYDNKFNNGISYEKQTQINNAMKEYFSRAKKELNIEFITPSAYDE